jgi:hypothetical protein
MHHIRSQNRNLLTSSLGCSQRYKEIKTNRAFETTTLPAQPDGPARSYHKVMLTVHVTDRVSAVSKVAAGYQRQSKRTSRQCVCHLVYLPSRHGDEHKPVQGGHLDPSADQCQGCG